MDAAPRKRITGKVKWFNAKNGFGFITRHDTGEDIFVHKSSILKPNRRHFTKSVGDGEEVEFRIIASNVTGPGFRPVKGSPFVAKHGIRNIRTGRQTKGRSIENSCKDDSEEDQSKGAPRRVRKSRPVSRTKRRSIDDSRKEVTDEDQSEVAPRGIRKSRPRIQTKDDSMVNSIKTDAAEDQYEELEKRTQMLTIKLESTTVESKRVDDKSSSEASGDAESTESITTVTAEQ